MKFGLLFLIISSSCLSSFTQSFSGDSFYVFDDGNYYSDSIWVGALDSSDLDSNFGLHSVCLNLIHTWDADLEIFLQSPDGTMIELSTNNGADGDNYISTCFDGLSAIPITGAAAPFTGNFLPETPLGIVNNHQSGIGYWKLIVRDGFGADEGYVSSWSLLFNSTPALIPPPPEFLSKLPIVFVNTLSAAGIPDEPKLTASMKVIDHVAGLNHTSDPYTDSFTIGIEVRGSSSATFPQQPYGFETWTAMNTDTAVSVLGLPAESDWIFQNTYNDKSFMRNWITFRLANDMGNYASRTRFCELIVNGDYKGIYLLLEKIKSDEQRVNIAKLNPDDTLGDDLTGGYIFKVDKWTGASNEAWASNYGPCLNDTLPDLNLLYHWPNPIGMHPLQKQYLHDWMDDFEAMLADPAFADSVNGYRKYINTTSFIDFMISQELGKNIDGYRLSTFLHKQKDSDGGKLIAGPIWDLNLAYGNADYLEGWDPTGFYFDTPCDPGQWLPFWWQRLYEDSSYVEETACRYSFLRAKVLSNRRIDSLIDLNYNLLDSAQARHFTRWPVLGVYVWPNAYVGNTFTEEVDSLRGWFHSRLQWMDNIWMDSACYKEAFLEPLDLASNTQDFDISCYPNPLRTGLALQLQINNSSSHSFELFDVFGKRLYLQENLSAGHHAIKLPDLPEALYLISIKSKNHITTYKLILQH